MLRKLLLLGGSAAAIMLMPLTSTLAASVTPTGGQALEISPTVSQINVDPGKSTVIPIKVHNISRDTQSVSTQVDDFTPNGETGLPKINLDSDGSGMFSFKRWIKVLPSFQIVSREIKAVNVKIDVPANATPGSHYGIIRFTASPPGLEGQGVSISTSLGLLAIFKVSGQTTESMKVTEFSINNNGQTSKLFESTPFTYVERLNNNGNTDLQPQGSVDLFDSFGHKVASSGVNQPPHLVLPDSSRRFEQVLDYQTIGNKRLFGHYTAKMNLTYGVGNKKSLVAVYSFWVIPYRLIIAIIFALLMLFILGRFLSRRYSFEVQAKPKSRRQ